MEPYVFYTLGSVIIVSLVSLIGAIPLLIKKKINKSILMTLLSISVGAILGTVFLHFLPEAIEHNHGFTNNIAYYILSGFLIFFILEKFVHHKHKCENKNIENELGHSHAYHLAPVNLIGDGVHNFIDGVVIAGSFIISVPLGIAATISIILHELPQEIADFGVLLYAGLSKIKALFFNFLSALTAILGAILGLIMGTNEAFMGFVIPFAAGNFLYIAASNLLPELHRHCGIKDSIIHFLAILFGIGVMILVAMLAPEHAHVHG